MFILYAVLIGAVVGALLRGDPHRLANVSFRWAPLIFGGLVCQVLLFTNAVGGRVGALGPPLYVLSTLAVFVAVARNYRITGVPIVIAGALCNLVAIVANGGYMPAAASAVASLGGAPPLAYSNSSFGGPVALGFLTDIFALPRWMPLTNVFSVGDVLIGIGVATAIAGTMIGGSNERLLAAVRLAGARLHRSKEPSVPVTTLSLATWDSRRSVSIDEQKLVRLRSVQGKPVVRRGTQS